MINKRWRLMNLLQIYDQRSGNLSEVKQFYMRYKNKLFILERSLLNDHAKSCTDENVVFK